MFSGSDIVQYFRDHFYFHANSIGENGMGQIWEIETQWVFLVSGVARLLRTQSDNMKRSWSGAGLVQEC